jgi:hypothetical protein
MVAFGAIAVWVPVVAFVFAFRLSMEYEVFLLSPIEEWYDECGNNDDRRQRPSALRDDHHLGGCARRLELVTSGSTPPAVAEMPAGRDLDRDDRRNREAAWRARRILKSRRSKLAP